MRRVLIVGLALACAPAPTTPTTRARGGDFVQRIEVSGVLEAVESRSVLAPTTPGQYRFKILSLAREGQRVKVGDPLVTFDAAKLEERRARARAEAATVAAKIRGHVASSSLRRQDERLKLVEAEATLKKRVLQVSQPGDLIGQIELRTLRIDRAAAEAKVAHQRRRMRLTDRKAEALRLSLQDALAAAEREVDDLGRSIERMVVRADQAGTVVYVAQGRRSKPTVGDSVYEGWPVLEVVDLHALDGVGKVAEVDVLSLKTGLPVKLFTDAYPDVELSGQVRRVSDSLTTTSRQDPSKVVRVRVALGSRKGLLLRPGMRFRGSIEVARAPKTVTVPASAVFAGPDGPIVYRKTGRGFERVAVILGLRSSDALQVVTGLRAGDDVALRVPQ